MIGLRVCRVYTSGEQRAFIHHVLTDMVGGGSNICSDTGGFRASGCRRLLGFRV